MEQKSERVKIRILGMIEIEASVENAQKIVSTIFESLLITSLKAQEKSDKDLASMLNKLKGFDPNNGEA